MKKHYTSDDKANILQELRIMPIGGMINSQEAARIMSRRAQIETEEEHSYGNDAVRWRVKSGKLRIAQSINPRLNLFLVDDIFTLDLEPQKWHSKRDSGKKKKSPKIHLQTP